MKKNHPPKHDTKEQKIERTSQKRKQHTSPSFSPTQASETSSTLATFDFDHFLSLPVDAEFDQLFKKLQEAPEDDTATVTTMPTYETTVTQQPIPTSIAISSADLDRTLNTGLPSGTLPDDPQYQANITYLKEGNQINSVTLDPTTLSEPLYFIDGKRLSHPVHVCKLHDYYYIWKSSGMQFLYTEKQLNQLHPMHYKLSGQWTYISMKETSKIREHYHANSRTIRYQYNLNNNIYLMPIVTANEFIRCYPSSSIIKHLKRFKEVDSVLFANITPGDYFRAHANYVTIHGKAIATDALVLNLFGVYCVIEDGCTHVIYDQAYLKDLQPFHYKIINQAYRITQEEVNAGVITETIRPKGPERLITLVSPSGEQRDLPVFFNPHVKSLRYTKLPSELKHADPLALVTASPQLSEVNATQNLAPFSIFTTSITTAPTTASMPATTTNDASLAEENPTVEQIYQMIGFDQ